jgi:hypothetical protein
MKFDPEPQSLRIVDNMSALARYNDDKSFVEFVLSRVIPVVFTVNGFTRISKHQLMALLISDFKRLRERLGT